MSIFFKGLSSINGPLVAIEGVKDASFDELVELVDDDNHKRLGRIIELQGERALIQVFENTEGMSKKNMLTKLSGKPIEIGLSEEILGRSFSGSGVPIDGLGAVFTEKFSDINGRVINPVSRIYPRNYINTGVSAIDGLNTLIRGQKLPIFSGSGLSHNELAAQIVRQAKLHGDKNENFAIVFAAMGVKHDVAAFFKQTFMEHGVMDHVTMFLNLANDPIIERILTPRFALTAAEYLAFEKNMHILVVMTDITSYCEALREYSSSKEEVPGRKGYPGYLYSDLASMYERAGCVEGSTGSLTQIPILTMPNDDISHPIADCTGYITEGQIVLDRSMTQKGIYPPINVLPSLSRLMKDGIGEGLTRGDHSSVSSQLFAAYAKVIDVRNLASVIGLDELSKADQKYLSFGKLFENYFIGQGDKTNRSVSETLDIGWHLLSLLPIHDLDRLDAKLLDEHYDNHSAVVYFKENSPELVDAVLLEGIH
ncbi:V-type ATP synthase subunit B [Erysipelothrix rhusiopathiae]|uniref:V-type ATP synthase subunit B n=1 Tax=Erysipelothrix rhusiopathiae TaxID=1648 RepID=UPI000F433AAA|nr:V-type ATP synthase subunit B [Erysipelothrix rhusiopathiae]AYV34450.1 V-type ATP synthase subunit B [Erysipelothrix rhusiopathiae]MDE8081054.1 V-type ATP synthase subunit B [Erysipelothrix rhusiopathiae]MDE8314526.1 V-type ATP synthase subunit B [Erysipelothrix rhusiopathiae]